MPRVRVNLGQPKKETIIEPSAYQRDIFEWISNGTGSAIIEAVAGSGKTTTIVQSLNLIPENESAIFLAFNKAIAEELKNRVPYHATASTFHSAGYRMWRNVAPKCRLDDRKVMTITKVVLSLRAMADFGMIVVNLVSLAKQRGIGCLVSDEPSAWWDLIEHFDILIEGNDGNEIIRCAQRILKESNMDAYEVIDFDDMIYMPVLCEVSSQVYDWVFVDEAQDTNGVRRALAGMLLADNGRVVAVGDPRQAIYGFTGADSDAMDLIGEEFGCASLPLSICYRSAKAIVSKAQEIVPEIEFSDTAPEGIVGYTTYEETKPNDSDAILCRMTAPLVNLAYEFISQGRGCRILGRDIGKGLVKLITTMKSSDVDDLTDDLLRYMEKMTTKYRKQDKESLAQALEDKVNCIASIISHLFDPTIEDLKGEIERMFKDNDGHLLTLCTIHKAKGLEWNRVFIHRPELMPCRWAKKPWQIEQEINIQYVAITRAKTELYFVKGE